MDRSTGRNPVESVSTEVSEPDLIDSRIPTIDFFPADIVRHMTPSNIVSNSNITYSSLSSRAFAMTPRPSSKGCRSRPCGIAPTG
jgi:hypothetical protein